MNAPQSFTFTVADYLSGNTTVPLAAFTACVPGEGDCTGAEFYENDPFNGFADRSLLSLQTTTSGTFYYFAKAAFTTNGVFSNADVGFNLATLTVSGFAEPAGVPEPASWALLIGGAGLVGGALRRRGSVRTSVRFA